MNSKIKYFIFFIILIASLIAIINMFPQLEYNIWLPLRQFLKYNLHYSFIIVTLFSLILGIVSSLVSYKVLDLPRLKRYQKEIQKWKSQDKRIKELKAAGTPNKKMELKIKRKKKYIEKIQREIASERMKPTFFTMIPFMMLFIILNGFIFTTASGIVVVIFPFNLYKVPFIGSMGYLGPVSSDMSSILNLIGQLKFWRLIPSDFFLIPPLSIGNGIMISPEYFFQNLYYGNNGYYLFFIGWYFISTFGFNSILQRLLGLNLET